MSVLSKSLQYFAFSALMLLVGWPLPLLSLASVNLDWFLPSRFYFSGAGSAG